jgi:hypothetical protein
MSLISSTTWCFYCDASGFGNRRNLAYSWIDICLHCGAFKKTNKKDGTIAYYSPPKDDKAKNGKN